MKSLALNLAVAVMWLLLSTEPSVSSFALGFGLGFLLLAVFRSIVGSESYVRRVVAFLRFILRFGVEFLRANARVAWAVLLRSRRSFRPDFVRYDISDLTRAEILVLSYCVSLTPGTTTVEIAEDFKTLTLHALDADRPDALRSEIDRTLKHGTSPSPDDLLVLPLAFATLTIAILLGLVRLARGPTVLDRVLAFDLIATCAVAMVLLLSIHWNTALYLELILIFSLLGFLTTVAFVFYLHKTVETPPSNLRQP